MQSQEISVQNLFRSWTSVNEIDDSQLCRTISKRASSDNYDSFYLLLYS